MFGKYWHNSPTLKCSDLMMLKIFQFHSINTCNIKAGLFRGTIVYKILRFFSINTHNIKARLSIPLVILASTDPSIISIFTNTQWLTYVNKKRLQIYTGISYYVSTNLLVKLSTSWLVQNLTTRLRTVLKRKPRTLKVWTLVNKSNSVHISV